MTLEANRADRLAAISRGLLGIAPYVGPILSELVTELIPNQRIERLVRFAKALDERLRDLDRERVRQRLSQPGFSDVVEDGLHQAARAITDERTERIATLVKNGIADEQARDAEWKRLLRLLGEISDFQVLLLLSRTWRAEHDEEFLRVHGEALRPVSVHMRSTKAERDEAALFHDNYSHLVSLGLLKRQFRRARRGEAPEIDEETGMAQESGPPKITRLGAKLLAALDLLSDEDIELQ